MKNIPDFAYPMPAPASWFQGRGHEILLLRESLLLRRMRGAILIGPAGAGKTELARAAAAQCPGWTFYEMSVAGSVAGMRYVGDFERRMIDFMKLVCKPNVCLYIDEAHTMMGAGARSDSCDLDLANILKPYISSGKLTLWCSTTDKEYPLIEADTALSRRLGAPIFVEPLRGSQALAALKSFCGGKIPHELLDIILFRAGSLEKALSVCDHMLARAELTHAKINMEMLDDMMPVPCSTCQGSW